MSDDLYKTVYGIRGDQVVPVLAARVEGGWCVKQGCLRAFVEAEKLSETREGAEERLRQLNSR